MNNKFIREGIEDFNWVEDVESGFTKVDTSRDEMNVWPQFEKMLSELGVTNLEGEVVSYDDEGTCKLLLKSDYFEFEVHANFDYIETSMVSWSIQNIKNYGYVKDEYSLDTNDWLKPIVDKLKEMVIKTLNKYKKMNESEDFEWISDIDAKLPTLGELFDDGRLEVDDIITLRGEVINGKNWKKKWFNEFVIELTSKGERLTSGTFFDLIDTPINNGVSESMGLSSDFEISFIDGDEKLEVLGVLRFGKEMDLFKLNESDDFNWIKSVESEFNATMLRYGQKFKDNLGKYTRIIMFAEQDDPEISYEPPMSLLTFKIIYDPSGYIPYPAKPKDDPLNSELDMNPIDFDNGLKSGKYVPIFNDKGFKLKLTEESDFDWIRDFDITNHIEMPYFKSMREYGLSSDKYELVLSKVYNQPVSIIGNGVYDNDGNQIYYEGSYGYWWKREYDTNGNLIYSEYSDGYWYKYKYDINGNIIYRENSDGDIEDNRNLNESDDFDWVRDIDVTPIENTGSSCDGNYNLVYDYFFSKRPIVHGNYTYYMDSTSGTVIWEFNDTEDYIVYATPFWDGNCYLPIYIQGDMGEYEELVDMELPKFNYREELFNWLENVYPNIVASTIDDLGPLPE